MIKEDVTYYNLPADEKTELLFCPFCGTTQIELIKHSNPKNNIAKCRECKGTAKVEVWNKRSSTKKFPF